MDIKQVKDLMNHLEASKLRKLVLKDGEFELHLEKEEAHPVPQLPLKSKARESEPESAFHSEVALKGDRGSQRSDAPGSYVESPMVGTFYHSPGPDQPPFVKVGDKVDENTVVCIVEAMKVMNEVKAGMSGTVAEVLVGNSEPIEYGTPLMRIT